MPLLEIATDVIQGLPWSSVFVPVSESQRREVEAIVESAMDSNRETDLEIMELFGSFEVEG